MKKRTVIIIVSVLALIMAGGCDLKDNGDKADDQPAVTHTQTQEFSQTLTPTHANTPEPTPTLGLGSFKENVVDDGKVPTGTSQSNLIPNVPFQPVHTEKELPPDLISILHASDDGAVWLLNQHDILILKDNTWEVTLADVPGNVLGVDQTGIVWVLDQDGGSISSWNGNQWREYSEESGWTELSEYSMVMSPPIHDQLGQLWIATSEGLRRFNGQRWERFTHSDLGFSHPLEAVEDAWPIISLEYLESNEELWLGVCNWTGAGPIGGQGVRRFDGLSWQKVSPELSSGCTEAITEDSKGRVRIGLDGDVWQYDPKTGSQIKFPEPKSPFEGSSSFGGVGNLALDLDDNPWSDFLLCGGAGCGFGTILYHFDGNTWIEIIQEDYRFHDLVFDQSGTPWLLSPGGIFEIVENQPKLFMELPIIPKSTMLSRNGQLWFLVNTGNVTEIWTSSPEILNN